ncbi:MULTISPECIES: DUF4190 domain-containing protein [unclassified Pseudonocardia]|uniref:DUF4190 domain-containing protein n=1 Tax=unclassified Pseudonocardia TaxID=2619320 RepID=UPI000962CA9D|nr:DUF4190 domain-containing protein [Pseudonocardia sp. Ae707_Ps1]OLM20120.1 hypothetical protein Ae707Ps1_4379 [Pseudonocardia sp. Ae707_Ps1]
MTDIHNREQRPTQLPNGHVGRGPEAQPWPTRADRQPPAVPAQWYPQGAPNYQYGPGNFPQGYPAMGASQPRNGLGIASLCLALAGAVFMLMPITGFIAVILGALGLVFGLIGWGRARRGAATNTKVAASGTILSTIVTVVGIIGVVMFFQAIAQFSASMEQLGSPASDSTPYVGAPAAPVAAPSTSYTYEVTGNYRATQLSYTASNGDSESVNETSDTRTAGSALPWTKTVAPEPNGNWQSLHGSTSSEKGDSWITCTIKDDKGTVVATETGRGAYASCYATTPFN